MRYDVAAKVVLSRCKSAVLSLLCGLPVTSASLLEARPQETASLRRSDFVFRATFEDGTERLILLEFLSYWKPLVPVRTLECRCRHLLEEKTSRGNGYSSVKAFVRGGGVLSGRGSALHLSAGKGL